jgi:Fur family ferric uptake transcriptional regulator
MEVVKDQLAGKSSAIAGIKKLEERLQQKQINLTAVRLLVLDFLEKQSKAVSLTDMEREMDPVDRVTLFRTVKTFEEHGLVHRIEDGTGATKFALCAPDCNAKQHQDLHVHFYCNQCKETYCLPKTHIPEVALPPDYQAFERELIVKGICALCTK